MHKHTHPSDSNDNKIEGEKHLFPNGYSQIPSGRNLTFFTGLTLGQMISYTNQANQTKCESEYGDGKANH